MHHVNLSYVLHERSGSRAVRRAGREARRFWQRRTRLLSRFDQLDDRDLSQTVIVTPSLQSGLGHSPDLIISAHVGVPELLQRTVSLQLTDGPTVTPRNLKLIDSTISPDECVYGQLFRATAVLPNLRASGAHRILIAALVVRPGQESLQLAGAILTLDEADQNGNLLELAAVRSELERIIRAHVDQWFPPRQLWELPAELGLDDLRTAQPTTLG